MFFCLFSFNLCALGINTDKMTRFSDNLAEKGEIHINRDCWFRKKCVPLHPQNKSCVFDE